MTFPSKTSKCISNIKIDNFIGFWKPASLLNATAQGKQKRGGGALPPLHFFFK